MKTPEDTTVTLLAVDLASVTEDWRAQPVIDLCGAAPRGRVAAALTGLGVPLDDLRPLEGAVGSRSLEDRRAVFDALVEDSAEAVVWDVPRRALGEAMAALAKVGRRKDLEADALDAAATPAYPDELQADRPTGLVKWMTDPSQLAHGKKAVERALDLPDGSLPAEDPALLRDLLDGLAAILDAATSPAITVLAARP